MWATTMGQAPSSHHDSHAHHSHPPSSKHPRRRSKQPPAEDSFVPIVPSHHPDTTIGSFGDTARGGQAGTSARHGPSAYGRQAGTSTPHGRRHEYSHDRHHQHASADPATDPFHRSPRSAPLASVTRGTGPTRRTDGPGGVLPTKSARLLGSDEADVFEYIPSRQAGATAGAGVPGTAARAAGEGATARGPLGTSIPTGPSSFLGARLVRKVSKKSIQPIVNAPGTTAPLMASAPFAGSSMTHLPLPPSHASGPGSGVQMQTQAQTQTHFAPSYHATMPASVAKGYQRKLDRFEAMVDMADTRSGARAGVSGLGLEGKGVRGGISAVMRGGSLSHAHSRAAGTGPGCTPVQTGEKDNRAGKRRSKSTHPLFATASASQMPAPMPVPISMSPLSPSSPGDGPRSAAGPRSGANGPDDTLQTLSTSRPKRSTSDPLSPESPFAPCATLPSSTRNPHAYAKHASTGAHPSAALHSTMHAPMAGSRPALPISSSAFLTNRAVGDDHVDPDASHTPFRPDNTSRNLAAQMSASPNTRKARAEKEWRARVAAISAGVRAARERASPYPSRESVILLNGDMPRPSLDGLSELDAGGVRKAKPAAAVAYSGPLPPRPQSAKRRQTPSPTPLLIPSAGNVRATAKGTELGHAKAGKVDKGQSVHRPTYQPLKGDGKSSSDRTKGQVELSTSFDSTSTQSGISSLPDADADADISTDSAHTQGSASTGRTGRTGRTGESKDTGYTFATASSTPPSISLSIPLESGSAPLRPSPGHRSGDRSEASPSTPVPAHLIPSTPMSCRWDIKLDLSPSTSVVSARHGDTANEAEAVESAPVSASPSKAPTSASISPSVPISAVGAAFGISRTPTGRRVGGISASVDSYSPVSAYSPTPPRPSNARNVSSRSAGSVPLSTSEGTGVGGVGSGAPLAVYASTGPGLVIGSAGRSRRYKDLPYTSPGKIALSVRTSRAASAASPSVTGSGLASRSPGNGARYSSFGRAEGKAFKGDGGLSDFSLSMSRLSIPFSGYTERTGQTGDSGSVYLLDALAASPSPHSRSQAQDQQLQELKGLGLSLALAVESPDKTPTKAPTPSSRSQRDPLQSMPTKLHAAPASSLLGAATDNPRPISFAGSTFFSSTFTISKLDPAAVASDADRAAHKAGDGSPSASSLSARRSRSPRAGLRISTGRTNHQSARLAAETGIQETDRNATQSVYKAPSTAYFSSATTGFTWGASDSIGVSVGFDTAAASTKTASTSRGPRNVAGVASHSSGQRTTTEAPPRVSSDGSACAVAWIEGSTSGDGSEEEVELGQIREVTERVVVDGTVRHRVPVQHERQSEPNTQSQPRTAPTYAYRAVPETSPSKLEYGLPGTALRSAAQQDETPITPRPESSTRHTRVPKVEAHSPMTRYILTASAMSNYKDLADGEGDRHFVLKPVVQEDARAASRGHTDRGMPSDKDVPEISDERHRHPFARGGVAHSPVKVIPKAQAVRRADAKGAVGSSRTAITIAPAAQQLESANVAVAERKMRQLSVRPTSRTSKKQPQSSARPPRPAHDPAAASHTRPHVHAHTYSSSKGGPDLKKQVLGTRPTSIVGHARQQLSVGNITRQESEGVAGLGSESKRPPKSGMSKDDLSRWLQRSAAPVEG